MPQSDDVFPRPVQFFIQGLIVYSIITMCMETMPELSEYQQYFLISEYIVVAIFTVEYLARWWRSDNPWRYPFTFMAVVDLLAILPTYLRIGIDLRSLRAIRLLRIFRLLKLGRYSNALQTLGQAFKRCSAELTMVGFLAAIVILISAMGLYYAENHAQPEVYSSIPASLWWAVVTLTTVGYGDVYPVTAVGRMIASVIMLLGIGFIAIPTGILSSTLTDLLREKRQAEAKTNAEETDNNRT